MKKLFTTLLSFVAVAIIMSPSALAQTPDGETPASESVCDVLLKGTPGLFGLCVAYCEAQDADITVFSRDILNRASHQRLLDNYNKKKREGDPDMPCLRMACPCWNADDIDAIESGKGASCFYSQSGEGNAEYQFSPPEKGPPCSGIAVLKTGGKEGNSCFYRNNVPDPNDPENCIAGMTSTVLDLTSEEVAACNQAIADGAATNGVQCDVNK